MSSLQCSVILHTVPSASIFKVQGAIEKNCIRRHELKCFRICIARLKITDITCIFYLYKKSENIHKSFKKKLGHVNSGQVKSSKVEAGQEK